uniref:RRM domain-containing protein n=1 Tax=Aegilops tauschii subsp. strangulata TaxID=200361 RepID=A0A453J4U5_AEGTS
MSSRAQQGEKGSESAARTRPLSIHEILLRREKKALAEAKKAAAEAKKAREELQGNDKGKPNHSEPGRGHKSRKDLKDVPAEGSKKESVRDATREDSKKDDVRRASKEGSRKESIRDAPKEVAKKENLKERPKDGSKVDELKDTPKVPRKDDHRDAPNKGSKKERSSVRDDSQSAGKDKDAHDPHKHSTRMRGRPVESKDGNHGEIRARNGDVTRSESLKGPGKRWNGEPVHNDRIMERSDKLRNEAKRKIHGFDDEKPSYVDRPVLKKHDSARFRVSKHYDINDSRREYGKPYREEPRSKRRRSRSRDHDQGRRDRSLSLSPREQRRSYHGNDHDNYPPGRKYAENDRYRTSDNVGQGGGSYQRYESRLGGYSPRKRKTVPQDEQLTTTNTPPVIRSPEKKPATWDQPPTAADQSNFFSNLQPIVSQTSSVSVSFSAPKQNPATALDTILSGNSSSTDSVQLTQATRPLRRLHIENLTSSASEDMLIGCLNDFLLSSGVNRIQRSKQPCLSCTINKEKRQAFVEFLTPEDATAALSFDGRSFNGSTLRIRRPKEYIEMAHVAQKKPVEEEIKEASDVVADSPHKIFIAGISGVLSSEMLVEIVSSFGQLAAYHFVCNEDLGGRCAFLEYIDHSITNKACAGLNGMKLGGCILTAVQVFPNPVEVRNEASPFYGIPDSAKALLEEPTNVLQLKNVFAQEEFLALSKPELEEILEDVRMECARFGAVKSINIVEYPASSDSITEDVLVEPKDEPVKLEPSECRANDNCVETGADCSLPSRSIVVPSNPMEITGAECQDHKELDTLRECDASVAADQYTDLDDIHARAAGPTVDQQTESDHMDSVQAADMDSTQTDQDASAVGEDSLGEGHAGPTTLEACGSTTPGDVVETSETEKEQQSADDVSESGEEKQPVAVADTRDVAPVSDTIVLEAGSILVEFMRKEAACMAAHSLHGRSFGDRTVSAGYAPHDLYLQRYPR